MTPYQTDIRTLCKDWDSALAGERATESIIRSAVQNTLDHAPVSFDGVQLEISVLLADDATLQALNREHRGKDRPTNILSFPQIEPEHLRMTSSETLSLDIPFALGDLALAYQTIRQEAAGQNKLFSDHLAHLVVHGTLHLLGYDHMDEDKANEMENLERMILAAMNIADPYQSGLSDV